MTPARFSPKRFMAGLVALAWCLALSGPAQAQPQANNPFPQLQRSTGFVVVNKGNGQLGYGTCWVVEQERNLVVTNVHVVGEINNVTVAFPRNDDNGLLLTKSASYSTKDYIAGKVIYRDPKRDLALIKLNALPKTVKELSLAAKGIEAGQKIWSIGNSGMAGMQLTGGTLWHQRTGTVKKVFFWRTKLNNAEQSLEVRVLMTDSGVKGGDSGGPVVDAGGKLVGVVSCTNNDGDYAVDLSEVKIFLQRALGKAPVAPHAAAGTWTVTWTTGSKDYYASMTLNGDGSGIWEGTKQFPGTYTYSRNQLNLNMPSSGVNGNVSLTWTNNNQFQFSIQYKDGPTVFTAVRR